MKQALTGARKGCQMHHMNGSIAPIGILVALLVSVFVVRAPSEGRAESDPHRPACVDAHCHKIKSVLQAHYCGASPFGNGPEDGCEIKIMEKPPGGVEVTADYACEWSDTAQARQCKQHGQPSRAISDILIGQLHRIGLPAEAAGQTYFTIWKLDRSGWSIATAYYSNTVGSLLEVCEVVTVIDDRSHATVLRKLPFQRTDADVPTVTEWALVDFADVEGAGQEDIILEADEYENHWLEVISLHDGRAKTIFSGLGYYL
jgi:hypothetical protein